MQPYTHHHIIVYGERKDLESRWWEFEEFSIRVPDDDLVEFWLSLTRHEHMMISRGHTVDQIYFLRHESAGYIHITILPIKDAPAAADFEYFRQCENQPDYIPLWKDSTPSPRIIENPRRVKYFFLWKVKKERKTLYASQLEREANIRLASHINGMIELFSTFSKVTSCYQPTARAPGPSKDFGKHCGFPKSPLR